MMDNNTVLNECTDPTKSFTIEIPCAMADRILKLAREKDTSLSGILIEALDSFLRRSE